MKREHNSLEERDRWQRERDSFTHKLNREGVSEGEEREEKDIVCANCLCHRFFLPGVLLKWSTLEYNDLASALSFTPLPFIVLLPPISAARRCSIGAALRK